MHYDFNMKAKKVYEASVLKPVSKDEVMKRLEKGLVAQSSYEEGVIPYTIPSTYHFPYQVVYNIPGGPYEPPGFGIATESGAPIADAMSKNELIEKIADLITSRFNNE